MENIQIVISKLGHYDSDVANKAKKELLLLRNRAIPHLVAALTNPDQIIVAEVTRLLGLFRKDANEAVEALVAISYLNNTKIRANAIASMGLIAEKAEICIPVLRRHRTDYDVNVRRHAIAALGVFGYATHNAMFDLVAQPFGEVVAGVVVIFIWLGGFWALKAAARRLHKNQPMRRLRKFSWPRSSLR